MKRLLRKIFFWDEPAKGAFFGLTLLFTLPRLYWLCVLGIVLPVIVRDSATPTSLALYSLLALTGAALLYELVVLGHFKPKGRPSWKGVCLGLCVCAILVALLQIFASQEVAKLWWIIPLGLFVFFAVHAFHPVVKVRDWAVAIGTHAVGGVLYYVLYVAMLRRGVFLMSAAELPNGLLLTISHSFCLQWVMAILVVLFIDGAYLLYGRVIAKGGGLPFRSLFGKGVVVLLLAYAVAYLASAGMAIGAMHDFRKAQKDLEAYWGLPVKTAALKERYVKSGHIDQDFWNELVGLEPDFSALFQKYDGLEGLVSNSVLPPDIHAEWKAAFNASAEVRRCEEMLDAQPPLPEGDMAFEDAFHSRMLSRCRSLARLEAWRVRFALEDNDIDAAKEALQRMDNISASLQSGYNMLSILVSWVIEKQRANMLCRILASGLADEAWLREQEILLLEKEKQIPIVHRRMLLGHAAALMDTMDRIASETSQAFCLLAPESLILLGHEGALLARCHCISDFADFPEKPAGLFARMLAEGLRTIGTRSVPEAVAALRMSRGLVVAELARLKTGAYPVAMDVLPEDPFSGKPLRYAVDECKIKESLFKLNDKKEDEEEYDFSVLLTPEARKQLEQLGLSEADVEDLSKQRSYVFETEERAIQAVQIWSVGPDGVDDGGFREPPKDDIRLVIPI